MPHGAVTVDAVDEEPKLQLRAGLRASLRSLREAVFSGGRAELNAMRQLFEPAAAVD